MKELLGLLEQLNIRPHRNLQSHIQGPQPKGTPGTSEDFLKFQHYQPGDALNQVDWKKYVKSKALLTKQFGDDQNYTVVLLVDTSRSMTYGNPSKAAYQNRLIEGIAYAVLYRLHPLVLVDMGTEKRALFSQSVNESIPQIKKWLNALEYSAKALPLSSDFYHQFSNCLLIAVTDAWDETYHSFIDQQVVFQNDLILMHLLSEEELDPTLNGSYLLTDCESGKEVQLRIDQKKIERYHKIMHSKCLALKTTCAKYGFRYINVSTSDELKPVFVKLGR